MKTYLFAILILTATNAGAGLNKWIDEHGKVHYSDQPPPTGMDATKLRGAPPPASAPAPAKSLTEREAELKKSRQPQAETARQQANAEIEKANCTAAQQVLRSLQQGGRIAEYDARGERRFIEDAEREQRITEARQEIEKWCK